MNARLTTSTRLAALLVICLMAVAPASAAALFWTGTSGIDNSWGTATNWNPASTPVASSDVTFNAASTNLSTTIGATSYQVFTLTQSGVTGDVAIGSTGGALTFNGNGIAWYQGAAHDLSISAPVVVNGATQAWWIDPGHKVTLSNSVAFNAPMFFRGNTTQTGAGTFSFSGNVTAASTFWVGDSGYRGNVEITGGTFTDSSANDAIIGQGGTGTLTVSGGTYTQTTSILYLGNSTSNGTLNVNGSGVVKESGVGFIVGNGGGSNGAATISGNGLFDGSAGGDALIGQSGGTGVLTVSGGKYIQSTTHILYLGNAGGNGTLTLNGSGVLDAATASSAIVVGRAGGTATLNLDGGTLFTSRSIRGSDSGAGTGTVYFNGGTLMAKDGDNANWLLSASTFNAIVKGSAPNGGAVFDTNGYNMGIPVALTHYAGGPAIDGGLTKNGAGTLTLSAIGTYNGGTIVNAGAITIGGPNNGTSSLGTGPLTVNANGTVNASGGNSFGWLTTGIGPVYINGGVINVGGSSTFSNIITMTGGTMAGAGGVYVGGTYSGSPPNLGFVINANATPSSVSNPIVLQGATTVNTAAGATANFTGNISEQGAGRGFIKTGAGTLTLSGVNSFTGGLSVTGGTLAADLGVTANLGGGANPAVTVGGASSTLSLTYNGTGVPTNAAAISLTGGSTLNLSTLSTYNGGAYLNTVLTQPINVSGNTTINLTYNVTKALRGTEFLLNSTAPANVTLNLTAGGSAANSAGAGWHLYNDVGAATGQLAAGSTLTINGGTAAGGPATMEFRLGGNAGLQAMLANTDVTFGTDPVNVNMGNGGSTTWQVNSLAGGGSSTVIFSDNNPSVLRINNGTAGGANFAGTIANGAGANPRISVVKAGTGTQIFSGTNTFTGGLSVTGGTLAADLGVTANLGGGANPAVTVGGAGSTLSLSYNGTGVPTNAAAISLTGGSTLNLSTTSTYNGGAYLNTVLTQPINVSGNTTINLTYNVTKAFRGTEFLLNSTAPANVTLNLAAGGSAANSAGAGWHLYSNEVGAATGQLAAGSTLTINGGTAAGGPATMEFRIGGNAALQAMLANTDVVFGTDPVNVNLGNGGSTTWQVNSLAGGGSSTVIFSDNNPSVLQINNGTAGGANFAGVITNGAGASPRMSVVKSGTGTQILSGANTYSGSTTVNAGRLVFSGAQTTNGSTSMVIASGATLEYAVASGIREENTVTYTGTGTLLKTGGGTVRWGAAVGTFNLGAGSLIDIQGGAIDAGSSANENWSANLSSLNVVSGALIAELAYTPARFDALTGAGTVSLDSGAGGGPHTFTLGANNTAAGVYNAAGTATFSGVISNGGSLIKTGSGTQILSGANSYTGSTTVNAGRLVFSGAQTTNGSTSMVIAGGATLEYAVASGIRDENRVTYTGTGTLLKTGAGSVRWGAVVGTFNLGAGSLIDVQGGVLDAGSNANEVWSSNLSSLNVASGATIAELAYTPSQFDALTGAGTVSLDSAAGPGPHTFTLGVNNTAAGVYNAAGTATFSGVISNGGALIKTGTGTQIFSGANTYTGGTTVNNGTLLVNNTTGSGTGSGPVVVNGGMLGGNGSIAGNVTINAAGNVGAGNSPGHLILGSNYLQGGTMHAELGGTTQGVSYDWIDVGGTATFNTGAIVDVTAFNNWPSPGEGIPYYILTATGGITNNDLSGITFNFSGAPVGAGEWKASIVPYPTGGANAEALMVEAVPEPATIALLGMGIAGIGSYLRRRRN